jgi:hypothetical protein
VRVQKPTTVLYVQKWYSWCPKCQIIEFNHEHQELGIVLFDGRGVVLPTPAEHNWLVLHSPTGWYHGLAYPQSKLGLVPETAEFGFFDGGDPAQ